VREGRKEYCSMALLSRPFSGAWHDQVFI
jgi:hypothetical protein